MQANTHATRAVLRSVVLVRQNLAEVIINRNTATQMQRSLARSLADLWFPRSSLDPTRHENTREFDAKEFERFKDIHFEEEFLSLALC